MEVQPNDTYSFQLWKTLSRSIYALFVLLLFIQHIPHRNLVVDIHSLCAYEKIQKMFLPLRLEYTKWHITRNIPEYSLLKILEK